MTVHTPKTKVQKEFLANVERARAAGVTQATCEAVYYALLGGLSYCRFDNGQVADLTDKYIGYCEEALYDKAVEANQQNNIKWAGFEN